MTFANIRSKMAVVLPILFAVAEQNARVLAQSPGTFTATGGMTTPRVGQTATLLTNGKVLIAGGVQFYPLNGWTTLASAELYDPASGTFTRAGDMTTTRIGQTATLLPDGRVLIAGGGLGLSARGNDAFASAELYDPASGTLAPLGI